MHRQHCNTLAISQILLYLYGNSAMFYGCALVISNIVLSVIGVISVKHPSFCKWRFIYPIFELGYHISHHTIKTKK